MKKNIRPINQTLQKVIEMRGAYFLWKNNDLNKERVGLIAREIEKIIPEVEFTNPVYGLKCVNYQQITAILTEAIKEQQKQIEIQLKEIDELK